MAHEHDVYDTGAHFEIDAITREITYTGDDKVIVIQGDHNSQILSFKMPRYIDGHDTKLCDTVHVRYQNGENLVKYKVKDLEVSAEDEEIVTFSWKLSRYATEYLGEIKFSVVFACSSVEDYDYVWGTLPNTDCTVLASVPAGVIIEE